MINPYPWVFPPPPWISPPLVMEQSEILQKSCLENGMKSGCRFPPPLVMEDLKTRGGKNPRIWVDTSTLQIIVYRQSVGENPDYSDVYRDQPLPAYIL